jgi:hypothetical protein
MTTVTISGTELTTYAGSVQHDYILSDVFSNNTFRHFGPEDTEDINQPIIIHGEAGYRDDDTDHTDQDAEITAADIPLFTPLKASNRVKRRSVDERPGLKHLENLGESHGKSVGRTKTTSIMQFMTGVADSYGNSVDFDFDTTSDGSAAVNAKQAFKDVMANMDELEVDNEDRFAVLKSSVFYELQDQDGVMSVDFGGQANRQTIGGNNDVIKYVNCHIVNVGIGFGTDYTDSSTYPTLGSETGLGVDMSDIIGIVWQKNAMAMREQTAIIPSIDWVARLQVFQVLTRYQYGLKAVVDTDSNGDGPGNGGIWLIKETSAA